jgi:hypothetical protein
MVGHIKRKSKEKSAIYKPRAETLILDFWPPEL